MAKSQQKNTKMGQDAPKTDCNNYKCPFHGNLSVRGRKLTGIVISAKMRKTATIEFDRLLYLKKYERYEKRRTRLKVHNPECISAKDGDITEVMECRPLSKTKNFVIIKKLGAAKGFRGKMEAREASKVTAKKEEINEVN